MLKAISSLLPEVSGGRWRLWLAIVVAAAASGASVGLMGSSAWLIARAAEMPPLMYLNVAIVGVRAFGIGRGAFRYVERLLSHSIALRLQSALRLRVYRRLASTTLLGRRSGDLLARIVVDVAAMMDAVVRVVLPFASASLVLGGTVAILWRFSTANALLLLGTGIIAGFVVPWWAARLSRDADREAAPLRGELAQRTHEFERCLRDLVALGVAADYRARLATIDAQLRDVERRAAWSAGVATGVQLLAAGFAVAVAVWCGADEAARGAIPSRMIAVLALVPLAMHEVFADATKALQTRTRVTCALTRVSDVLDAPTVGRGDVVASAEVSGTPSVEVRDLVVGWPGQRPVVGPLSFRCGPGERLAITAPSGGGKTTLAATLLGMIPAQAGSVTITGRVGYLAQDAHVFATSVAENLRLGNPTATDEQLRDALASVGLDWSLGKILDEYSGSISGGEARRLCLARLTLGDFDIFVFDEPTEHLDERAADQIVTLIDAVSGNAPVIIFTHDKRLVSQCGQEKDLGPLRHSPE